MDAADWDNYLKLLREMRAAMDAAYPDEHKELTIAMGMGIGVTGEAPMSELADILDAINLMTYDYNGAWDTGLIGHNAPLYADDAYPGPPSHFVDWGVNAWLQNVPASKLVLGLPAYGRAWANPSHGQQLAEYGSSTDAGEGTWEKGVYSWWDIKENFIGVRQRGWNNKSKVPYLIGADEFVSYDDEESIAIKASYAKAAGLAGMMWWEASDDPHGQLLAAANAAWNGAIRGDPLPRSPSRGGNLAAAYVALSPASS